jgi:hypothetical protein
MLAHNFMRNGGAGPRQLDHGALGRVDCFADRLGDLVRLPGCDPHLALPIPNSHQRVEGETPATLDHLGHAIDGDDILDVIAWAVTITTVPPGPSAAPVSPFTASATAPPWTL